MINDDTPASRPSPHLRVADWLMICLLLVMTAGAAQAVPVEKRIEKDTDGNGVIDLATIYDPQGRLVRVETDSDGDGRLDRFQYYSKDALVRIERDMDTDGTPEIFDYFTGGKRRRQERKNIHGKVLQVALFNDVEEPVLIKKDTTESGVFDQVYHFKSGLLDRMTSDPDENGTINIIVAYANTLPVFKTVDDTEDGKPETEVTYDSKGLPQHSRHDQDLDGTFDTFRFYEKGDIVKQENDRNQDGVMDRIITFAGGLPVDETKDMNFDRTMDCFMTFDGKGQIENIREDSRYSGHIDRIRDFSQGLPVKTVYDTDGDGFLESVFLYRKGKLTEQTRDENSNGTVDTRIFFNAHEEKERMEADTDFNGRVDLKIAYVHETKIIAEKDADGDNYFETIERYDRPGWDRVTETDGNANRVFESRFYFKGGVMRQRDIDENEDLRPDLVEYFNAEGKQERSEEYDPEGGIVLVWLYNQDEIPWCAEQDADKDGFRETRFFYENGRLKSVEEDTNKDGRPDLWETYDEAEVLISSKQDFDFDGVADLVRDKDGSHPLVALKQETVGVVN